jgi:hypothetical protein
MVLWYKPIKIYNCLNNISLFRGDHWCNDQRAKIKVQMEWNKKY